MTTAALDALEQAGTYPEPVTPAELRAWRTRLRLSQERLAHELGVTFTTVWRWEKGQRPVPHMVQLAMREIERQQLDAEHEEGPRG
jgi:DNA-binding transcriptional regulator YiaG